MTKQTTIECEHIYKNEELDERKIAFNLAIIKFINSQLAISK